MALIGDIKNLASGETALQVDVPTQSIVYLSIGIFVAVLLAVILANELSK